MYSVSRQTHDITQVIQNWYIKNNQGFNFATPKRSPATFHVSLLMKKKFCTKIILYGCFRGSLSYIVTITTRTCILRNWTNIIIDSLSGGMINDGDY